MVKTHRSCDCRTSASSNRVQLSHRIDLYLYRNVSGTSLYPKDLSFMVRESWPPARCCLRDKGLQHPFVMAASRHQGWSIVYLGDVKYIFLRHLVSDLLTHYTLCEICEIQMPTPRYRLSILFFLAVFPPRDFLALERAWTRKIFRDKNRTTFSIKVGLRVNLVVLTLTLSLQPKVCKWSGRLPNRSLLPSDSQALTRHLGLRLSGANTVNNPNQNTTKHTLFTCQHWR